MKKHVLTRQISLMHLRKYRQYSKSDSWPDWYSRVAPLKGERTAKMLLNYKNSSASLLDLGCGIGLTLAVLGKYFPKAVGAEVTKEAVGASRELLRRVGVGAKVILYDGKKLPFLDNSFDIVTCIDVYEHAVNPEDFLKEIRRVLKPDGIMHITAGNKLWPIEPHYKLPFLSYLPGPLANGYVRLMGLDASYQGIHLPTYGEFYRTVNKYFSIEDLTINILRNYEDYNADKERGIKVVLVGKFLKVAKIKCIDAFLNRLSLGWFFICHPRK